MENEQLAARVAALEAVVAQLMANSLYAEIFLALLIPPLFVDRPASATDTGEPAALDPVREAIDKVLHAIEERSASTTGVSAIADAALRTRLRHLLEWHSARRQG